MSDAAGEETNEPGRGSGPRLALIVAGLGMVGVVTAAVVSGLVAVAVADRQIASSEAAAMMDVRRAVYSDFLTRSTQMELRLLEIAETGSDVYISEANNGDELEPLIESVIDAYADLLQANVQVKLVAPEETRTSASDHVGLVGLESLAVICENDDTLQDNCAGVLIGLLVAEVESRPTAAEVQTDPGDGLVVQPVAETTKFEDDDEVSFDSGVELSGEDVDDPTDGIFTKLDLEEFKSKIRQSRELVVRAFRADMEV